MIGDPAGGADAVLPSTTRTTARYDRGLATTGLMIATALQAADATVVNVALPQLDRALGGGIVDRRARPAAPVRHARHVDNDAMAVRHHVRQHRLHAMESPRLRGC